MRLFPNETFLVYRTRLVGDLSLLMYWDLDCQGRAECVGQFLRIGKGDPIPLKSPLLLYRPPKIEGIFDKRELAYLIGEEIERKRSYLDRMGERLRKQVETLVLTGRPFYFQKDETENRGVSEICRRFLFLMGFVFGMDGNGDRDDDKKPP